MSELDDLYLRAMPDAVGLAYLLTGDRAEAAGMADDAFLRAAGRFAHRLGRERFPGSLRRHVVALFLRRERDGGAGVDGRAAPAGQSGPEGGGPAADRRDGMWTALASLPARARA